MSEIQPTRVELPLGGGLEYGFSVDKGTISFSTDASYTFEATIDGTKYRAVGCRVRHWDTATGVARLQPEMVMRGGS